MPTSRAGHSSGNNLHDAISAYAAIKRNRPRTRLVLVGDGPLRAKLAAQHPDILFRDTQHGHARHAVSFTLIALHYFPTLTSTLIPFTLMVALSRPVLGLHYPSDVFAGALLGAGLAGASLALLR